MLCCVMLFVLLLCCFAILGYTLYIKCSMFSGYVMNVVLFALLCYDVLCLVICCFVL